MKSSTVRLHEGEQVLVTTKPSTFWTWPLFVFTLGLWYFWRNRHVYYVTNQRVLVTMGIISKSEASAPLSRIQDLHVKRSILTGGKVAWSTAGGALGITMIDKVTRADAMRIADTLSPLIGVHPAVSLGDPATP